MIFFGFKISAPIFFYFYFIFSKCKHFSEDFLLAVVNCSVNCLLLGGITYLRSSYSIANRGSFCWAIASSSYNQPFLQKKIDVYFPKTGSPTHKRPRFVNAKPLGSVSFKGKLYFSRNV